MQLSEFDGYGYNIFIHGQGFVSLHTLLVLKEVAQLSQFDKLYKVGVVIMYL